MMVPLRQRQGCSPAEELHPSQGVPSNARRAIGVLVPSWVLASWNVRTLLDVEGAIETARRGDDDAQVVDERKVDQVVHG